MTTRREGTIAPTGYGVGAPAVPVPTPNAGGVGPVGSVGNPHPNTPSGGTMNYNPIPNNTAVNPGDAVGFVTNFRFRPENRTGIPEKDLAQDTFNRIADRFGHNAAWTWMMQSAWNQLGGYGPGGMREIMDKALSSRTDMSRIINTYGANGKYFDGLSADTKSMGNPFSPNPETAAILAPWKEYQRQASANYGNRSWQYQAPQGYQPYTATGGGAFTATGTNTDPTVPVGYGGSGGINPQTGLVYGQTGAAATTPPATTTPPPAVPPPATPPAAPPPATPPAAPQSPAAPGTTTQAGFNSLGIAPTTTNPTGTDTAGWNTWAQRVQNRTPR